MRECAILLAAIALVAAGCASNGSASRYSSAAGRSHITPLDAPEGIGGAMASETSSASRTEGGQEGDTMQIPLYQEQLQVSKREVPKGSVILRKVVESYSTNVPVTLRHEELVIERVSSEEGQTGADVASNAFNERTVVIELDREVPEIEKSVALTGVVQARKTVDTNRETITESVRKESIDVDRENIAANQQMEVQEASGGPGASTSGFAQSGNVEPVEQDSAEIPLYKEQIDISKRAIPNERIVLRKTVETENVSQPIELRSEDVEIERVAGGEAQSTPSNAFQNQEIRIALTEEVPVVRKEVRLSEIVQARKSIESEQDQVAAQLRREEVEIIRRDSEGGNEQSAAGAPGAVQTGQSSPQTQNINQTQGEGDLWTNRDRFSGTITMIDPETRTVSVRNDQGETRTFSFSDKPVLTIKENRAPSLINFKVGYPVVIGHRGDTAEVMIRADTPEVR